MDFLQKRTITSSIINFCNSDWYKKDSLNNKDMYKFLLIFFVGFLCAQQTCNLSFSNSSFLEDGKIIFITKNVSEKKLKIPKKYPSMWARAISMQVYNSEKKDYELTKYIVLNLMDALAK